MGDPAVPDFEPTKETEVEEEILWVLGYQLLDLFEDVVEDDFAGLLL